MLDARIKKQLGSGNGHTLTIDVNVRVTGGVTVLFGSSGAGKTSILRAIAGIITPDQGRISLGETIYFDSAAGISLPMQQRKVGYVFQNHALFPHLTAEQNVLYGAEQTPGFPLVSEFESFFLCWESKRQPRATRTSYPAASNSASPWLAHLPPIP